MNGGGGVAAFVGSTVGAGVGCGTTSVGPSAPTSPSVRALIASASAPETNSSGAMATGEGGESVPLRARSIPPGVCGACLPSPSSSAFSAFFLPSFAFFAARKASSFRRPADSRAARASAIAAVVTRRRPEGGTPPRERAAPNQRLRASLSKGGGPQPAGAPRPPSDRPARTPPRQSTGHSSPPLPDRSAREPAPDLSAETRRRLRSPASSSSSVSRTRTHRQTQRAGGRRSTTRLTLPRPGSGPSTRRGIGSHGAPPSPSAGRGVPLRRLAGIVTLASASPQSLRVTHGGFPHPVARPLKP